MRQVHFHLEFTFKEQKFIILEVLSSVGKSIFRTNVLLEKMTCGLVEARPFARECHLTLSIIKNGNGKAESMQNGRV